MIMPYIYAGLGGAGLVGALWIWHELSGKDDPDPVIVSDVVAQGQQDVIKQLTNLDLLAVPCSAEHIEKHGALLCRELFCRQTTRGIDSQTSGAECEQIANIANTLDMVAACQIVDNDKRRECLELFRSRK